MNEFPSATPHLDRRGFLRTAGAGLFSLALHDVLRAAQEPQDPQRGPHFAPRCKRVIWLFQAGGAG